MQSEFFIFDGIESSEMEQYLIRMSSGGVSSPFFGGQNIQEGNMRNKVIPYLFGTETKPISFTIEITPIDANGAKKKWTPQLKREIGRWLIHDTYKPFQTSDDLGKIYYAMVTEAPNFQLYDDEGHIPFTFRTNSPYAWSPIYLEEHDLSTNSGTRIIYMENRSNINTNFLPIIEIQLMGGNKNVKLENLSSGAKPFEFIDLQANSMVSVDNENEVIRGASPVYGTGSNADVIIDFLPTIDSPFAKFNGGWLELVYGVNTIRVTGRCKIRTKMQFPILQ